MDVTNQILTIVKELQESMVKLEKKTDENYKAIQANTVAIEANKAAIEENKTSIQATYAETRAVNQRLAVFQEEMSRKVQTLFDADLTRQQHLEAYDEKIQKIESELFNNSIRIGILESKVVGA